jgi:hypothetical protein
MYTLQVAVLLDDSDRAVTVLEVSSNIPPPNDLSVIKSSDMLVYWAAEKGLFRCVFHECNPRNNTSDQSTEETDEPDETLATDESLNLALRLFDPLMDENDEADIITAGSLFEMLEALALALYDLEGVTAKQIRFVINLYGAYFIKPVTSQSIEPYRKQVMERPIPSNPPLNTSM